MLLITDPPVDPARFSAPTGVELRSFVPDLHRHLAASDLAVVQGGLTTCMELTACQRPFVYVPLRLHFEQNFHVHHRRRNHGAGRRLGFAEAEPDALAELIAAEMGRTVNFRAVESDGAVRAAEAISHLI